MTSPQCWDCTLKMDFLWEHVFMCFWKVASYLGFRSIKCDFPSHTYTHTHTYTNTHTHTIGLVGIILVNICCQRQVMVRWDHIVAPTQNLAQITSTHTLTHTHKYTHTHTVMLFAAQAFACQTIYLRLSVLVVTAWYTNPVLLWDFQTCSPTQHDVQNTTAGLQCSN